MTRYDPLLIITSIVALTVVPCLSTPEAEPEQIRQPSNSLDGNLLSKIIFGVLGLVLNIVGLLLNTVLRLLIDIDPEMCRKCCGLEKAYCDTFYG